MERESLTLNTAALGGIMYVGSEVIALEWNRVSVLSCLACVFLREVMAWWQ